MESRIIDLQKYTTPGVGILAGRDRGEYARRAEALDRVDTGGTLVVVQIPRDVYSVNSSFTLGMFDKSVQTLGAEGFRKQYTFSGPDGERIRDELIRKALLLGRPFRPRPTQVA